MVILDTNVLSALMERRPSAVVDWLDRQAASGVWTTAITMYESRLGIALLPLFLIERDLAAGRLVPAFGGPVRATLRSGAAALRTGFHLQPGMRVGLYGGSFNPAHDGHAHVAETARKRLGLDRVIWLVSPQNPLKSARDTAPLVERRNTAK